MRFAATLFTLLLVSSTSFALMIEVENPKKYSIREFDGVSLPKVGRLNAERITINVPDQFVRRKNGEIQFEETLEAWRIGSRKENGQVLNYPDTIGGCNYEFSKVTVHFGNKEYAKRKKGCDFYPFQDQNGETKYIALRFMYREGEKEKYPDSAYGSKEVTDMETGKKVKLSRVLTYQRPRFIAKTEKGDEEIEYNFIPGRANNPEPVVGDGGAFVKGMNEYTIYPKNYSGSIPCDKGYNAFQCMVCNCHYETRGESEKGRIAVAKVVKTRVGMRRPDFPNTVCGVIYDTLHFSWTWDDIPNAPISGEDYRRCHKAAVEGLKLETHYASHYHNPKKAAVNWKCFGKSWTIGGHRFYEMCDSKLRADPELMRMTKVED